MSTIHTEREPEERMQEVSRASPEGRKTSNLEWLSLTCKGDTCCFALCVCVCVCVCAHACVCVCVCVLKGRGECVKDISFPCVWSVCIAFWFTCVCCVCAFLFDWHVCLCVCCVCVFAFLFDWHVCLCVCCVCVCVHFLLIHMCVCMCCVCLCVCAYLRGGWKCIKDISFPSLVWCVCISFWFTCVLVFVYVCVLRGGRVWGVGVGDASRIFLFVPLCGVCAFLFDYWFLCVFILCVSVFSFVCVCVCVWFFLFHMQLCMYVFFFPWCDRVCMYVCVCVCNNDRVCGCLA